VGVGVRGHWWVWLGVCMCMCMCVKLNMWYEYMASTRNKNTGIDYRLQQNINNRTQQYAMYVNGSSGVSQCTRLPGDGLGNAGIPGEYLSGNYIDIESFLRGTGTSNLVAGTYQMLNPELYTVPTVNIYTKKQVILPVPLYKTDDRPWPI
jgi:hypothetical protein